MREEADMGKPTDEKSMERLFDWARRHPFAATTAAVVLIAALALPLARTTKPPAADLGPDETPLFV